MHLEIDGQSLGEVGLAGLVEVDLNPGNHAIRVLDESNRELQAVQSELESYREYELGRDGVTRKR